MRKYRVIIDLEGKVNTEDAKFIMEVCGRGDDYEEGFVMDTISAEFDDVDETLAFMKPMLNTGLKISVVKL